MHSAHAEFKASHRAKPHTDGVGKYTPPVKARGRGRHCWEFIFAKNRTYHILNMSRLSHREMSHSEQFGHRMRDGQAVSGREEEEGCGKVRAVALKLLEL